jgi:hypothetical protein
MQLEAISMNGASAVKPPKNKTENEHQRRIDELKNFFSYTKIFTEGLVHSLVPIIAGYADEKKFRDKRLLEQIQRESKAKDYWESSKVEIAFLTAAHEGYIESLNYLFDQWHEAKLDVSQQPGLLPVALALATAGDNQQIVQAIKSKYPTTNAAHSLPVTANNHIVYCYLQIFPQDLNASNKRDDNNFTLLMRAARYGKFGTVQLLLHCDQTDPTLVNEETVAKVVERKTALAYAIVAPTSAEFIGGLDGYLQCVRLFLQHYLAFPERSYYQPKNNKFNYPFTEEKRAQQFEYGSEGYKELFTCFRKAWKENEMFLYAWNKFADKKQMREKIIAIVDYYRQDSIKKRMTWHTPSKKSLDAAGVLVSLLQNGLSAKKILSHEEVLDSLQGFRKNPWYTSTKPNSTFCALLFWLEAQIRKELWLRPIPKPQVMLLEEQVAVDAKAVSVRELTATATVNAAAAAAAVSTLAPAPAPAPHL